MFWYFQFLLRTSSFCSVLPTLTALEVNIVLCKNLLDNLSNLGTEGCIRAIGIKFKSSLFYWQVDIK